MQPYLWLWLLLAPPALLLIDALTSPQFTRLDPRLRDRNRPAPRSGEAAPLA